MPNIDEKVVQMTFDNKQFEKGVAQSLKSLEDLKKALELDKMSNSLKSLETVTNAMSKNFGELENNVKRVANVFTPLGHIVHKAMDDIASTIVSKAKSFAMLATGMESLQEGGQKYEKYTKSVQVITNATGKSVDEVSKHLDKLLKYTDETSYDFSEMVSSIGKFTSVGIDLERAEAAMEGIANWAAKSGAGKAEANRAMYNISQSMGAGAMKLIDWKSIENANMATKEFKEVAIQTAEELGVITKNSGITYQNFNETLKDGWLTADVMTTVLSKYADTSTDFGLAAFHAAQEALSFTDAIDALKDAMSSGWMKSREYMFGNLDEARVLWTDFANALIEFSDIFTSARNELLKGWHELGGYKAAIEAVSNAWAAFMNIAYGVRDALASLLPEDLPKRMVELTENFRDITASWKETFGIDTELTVTKEVDILKNKAEDLNKTLERGAKSDYVKDLQEQLIKGGYLKDKYGADGIYGPNTQNAIKKLQKDLGVKVTGSWDEATKEAAIAQKKFMAVEKGSTEINLKNVEEVTELQKKEIDHAKELDKVLKQGDKSGEVRKLQEELVRLGYLSDESQADGIYGKKTAAAIKELQKKLGVEVTGAWDKTTMAAVKSKRAMVEFTEEEVTVYKKTSGITSAMKTIQDIVKGVASAVKVLGSLALSGIKIIGGVLSMFKPLVHVGGTVLSMFGDMFTNFAKGIETENGIASATERIIGFFKPLGDLILIVSTRINDFVKGYYNFLKSGNRTNTFTSFFDYLQEIASGNGIISGFFRLFTNIKNVISDIITFISTAFRSVFSSKDQKKLIGSPKKNGIVAFLTKLLDIVTVLINGIAMGVAIIGYLLAQLYELALKYIGPIAQEIGGFISNLASDFKNGKVNSISDFFKSLSAAFSKTTAGKFLDDTSDKISGFFNKVKTYFVNKFPGVFDFFEKKWTSLKEFMKFDSSKGFFDNLKSKFEEIKIAVTGAINNIKDKLLEFKNYIVWLFTKNESGKLNLFGEIMVLVSKLKPILDTLIAFKNGFVETIKEIFGAAEGEGTDAGKGKGPASVLDKIKDFLKSVASFDFGKYLLPAIGSLVAFGLFKNIKAIKNFTEGLANLIAGQEKDSFGDTALKVAGAVAALALAVGLLSLIDAGKALAGIGALTLLLTAFVGATYLFSKIDDDSAKDFGKQLLMASASIAALAIGLGLLIKVFKNGLDPENVEALTWALGTIGVLLLAFFGMEFGLKKANGADAKIEGILDMCLGIGVLVLAIGALAKIIENTELGVLAGALGIIAGAIVLMGGLQWLLIHEAGKADGGDVEASVSGIIQMCIGIQFLVAAFASLVKIVEESSWEDLTWASVIMAGMLVAVGLIAKNMASDTESKDAIIKAIALAGSIVAFGYAIGMIADGMAEAITKVQDVNPWVIVTFFGGMAALLFVAGQVVATMGTLDLTVMLKGVLGLVLVGAAVALLVAVFLAIGTAALEELGTALFILGSGLTDYNNMMTSVDWSTLKTISDQAVEGIKTIVEGLLPEILQVDAALDTAEKIKSIGIKLKMFAMSMSYFDENASANIGYATSAVNDIKTLTDTMNTISVVEGVDTTLTNLGAALSLYYKMIQGIGTDAETGEQYDVNLTKVDSQMISDAFSALKEAIPVDDIETLKSYAEGGDNDMTKVALGIEAIGAAVKSYGDNVGGIKKEDVEAGNSVITTLANLYTTISDADAIKNVFDLFGDTTTEKIDHFSEQLVAIGTGMESYITSIKDINSTKINLASSTITLLADIANKLPDTSGFLGKLIGGNQSLGQFGSNMSTLGKGVANYANEVAAGDFTNVDSSLAAVDVLADISGKLQKSGGLSGLIAGDKNLGLLSKGLNTLGSDLNTFAETTQDFKYSQVEESFTAIESLITMFGSLGNLTYYDWGTHNKMTEFGTGLKGMFNEIASIYTDTVTATVKEGGFFRGAETVSIPVLEAMSQLGKFMIDGVVSGIDSSNGGEDGSGMIRSALMRAIIDAVTTAKKIETIYVQTGEYLIDGLIKGIDNKYQELINKLSSLGKDSAEALQKATDVNSPSKLFYWIAEMWIEGLTTAIEDNSENPTDALNAISNYITDSFNIGVDGVHTLFDSLVDAATNAAKNYKSAADTIVESNTKIKKSNAQKPSMSSSTNLDRLIYEQAHGMENTPEFKEKQKEIAKYDKELEKEWAKAQAGLRTPKGMTEEDTKKASIDFLKRRQLVLEQYGYLDPSKYNNGKVNKDMFNEAYANFLSDIGMYSDLSMSKNAVKYWSKSSSRFNTSEYLIEKYIKDHGGIGNAMLETDRRRKETAPAWESSWKEFEELYSEDYMKTMGSQNGESYMESLLESAANKMSEVTNFNDPSGDIVSSILGDADSVGGSFMGMLQSYFTGEEGSSAFENIGEMAMSKISDGLKAKAEEKGLGFLSPVIDSVGGSLPSFGFGNISTELGNLFPASISLDETSKLNLAGIDSSSALTNEKLENLANQNATMNTSVASVLGKLDQLISKDGNVYIDSNRLVGSIGRQVSQYIGNESAREARRR